MAHGDMLHNTEAIHEARDSQQRNTDLRMNATNQPYPPRFLHSMIPGRR